MRKFGTPLERLKEKFDVAENGCWMWKAANVPKGYGVMYFNGRQQYAHRISYQIHVGAIPDGLFVLHRCDTPACVNPEHLFLGTLADNTADMMAKGRSKGGAPSGDRNPMRIHKALLSGEKNGSSKLTMEQVEEIRRLYKAGVVQTKLAVQFGVNQPHISRIVRGESWVL
jgi:hypothetical protein